MRVDSYNLDVTYEGTRLAALTNKHALKGFLDKWRKVARLSGADAFGTRRSAAITKKELDAALASEDYDARTIVHGTIEDFSGALALLVERLLAVPEWRHTECVVVGGGVRASVTGELIIRRARALLNARGGRAELRPIHSHPHDAALIGAAHLVPSWMLAGHDAILAADIGGTNIRVGIVRLDLIKDHGLANARVWKRFLWRHADHEIGREALLRGMIRAMRKLIRKSEAKGLRLAPYIGIACPGFIGPDGSIGSGSEVLPGNWQSPRFNLPARILEDIPAIGGRETLVLLHNDAVVQGLSEIPFMRGCRRWGVLTVGTGLGNARFSTPDRLVTGK